MLIAVLENTSGARAHGWSRNELIPETQVLATV